MKQLLIFDQKQLSSLEIIENIKKEYILIKSFKKYSYIDKTVINKNDIILFVIYDFNDVFEGISKAKMFENFVFATHNLYLIKQFKKQSKTIKIIDLNKINNLRLLIRT